MGTHEKCRLIIKRMLADQKSAKKISKGVFESYDVVEEALLFDSALARIRNAVLLTDDGGQHFHAEEIGVGSVLIREANIKQIEDIIS